jgi:hypothetical protein
LASIGATSASTLGSGFTTRSIDNISVTANVALQITLPVGTRRVHIQFRGNATLEVRNNELDLEYWTVYPGNTYEELDLSPIQTYSVFVTSNNSGVLEILSWA